MYNTEITRPAFTFLLHLDAADWKTRYYHTLCTLKNLKYVKKRLITQKLKKMAQVSLGGTPLQSAKQQCERKHTTPVVKVP